MKECTFRPETRSKSNIKANAKSASQLQKIIGNRQTNNIQGYKQAVDRIRKIQQQKSKDAEASERARSG